MPPRDNNGENMRASDIFLRFLFFEIIVHRNLRLKVYDNMT